MQKKLIIVKAKIGKHIYKIEMEVKSSFSEIIKEVAIQHEVEPNQVEIKELSMIKEGKETWKLDFAKSAPTNTDFKNQYMQSPH